MLQVVPRYIYIMSDYAPAAYQACSFMSGRCCTEESIARSVKLKGQVELSPGRQVTLYVGGVTASLCSGREEFDLPFAWIHLTCCIEIQLPLLSACPSSL